MPEEPDNLALAMLRSIRGTVDDHSARFGATEAALHDVRLTMVRRVLRFDALEEHVEAIREGALSAIGFAANAGRAHVDLRRQIADLTRRVEKLEAGR